MRGKRSKQYRKLMEKFSLAFGFREPYQVLVDADVVKDSSRFKMDLAASLERTLHGKVKPMITQCCMRHLYDHRTEPGIWEAIQVAKTCERRRCGHHPDDFPEPLSTEECLTSVVDPKKSGVNTHRYVVATQEQEVRRVMRRIKGVPLIYIARSVMIMEPMSEETAEARLRDERSKFRAEIKKPEKRKRDKDDAPAADGEDSIPAAEGGETKKRRKAYGPKGPNPLSIKKPKKQQPTDEKLTSSGDDGAPGEVDDGPKRKRRRRHKTVGNDSAEAGRAEQTSAPAVAHADAENST